MGPNHGWLLCIPIRSSVLVVRICTNARKSSLRRLYSRFTGKVNFNFSTCKEHSGWLIPRLCLIYQVNPYLGTVIEGVATLLCRLASRALGELGPRHASIIDSFIGTSLVVAGTIFFLDFCNGTFRMLFIILQRSITRAVISIPFWQLHWNGVALDIRIWSTSSFIGLGRVSVPFCRFRCSKSNLFIIC